MAGARRSYNKRVQRFALPLPIPYYDYINKKNPSTMHVEGHNFIQAITYTYSINDVACRGL